MFSHYFFRSLPHGGSLTWYSSPWTILILHLLIIWAFTWVPVPSDTLFGFLWVVVAKTTLFRGLLNINAARKVAAVHSMRWYQLSLRYFWGLIVLRCLWYRSLSLELPGRSSWLLENVFETYLSYPRRYSSSDYPPICISLIESWVWTIHYHSLVLRLLTFLVKAQYMIWALNPTIAPQKFGFFLSFEEKSGVLIFLALILFCPLTCTCGSAIYASHDCYWRFEAREVSLIAPGGVLFPLSNG